MIKVLKKIDDAIAMIKDSNLEKKGRNTFSGYSYYTPEQVSALAMGASHNVKILPKFDLVRDEFGKEMGRLTVYDLESDESVVYTMASAIPEIKATNVAQQLGGAMTYTKRYMLMNTFDIVDNGLDFDTSENTAKMKQDLDETMKELEEELMHCKTIEDVTKVWKANPSLHTNKEFKNKISRYSKTLQK
ncbi:MAG: ERF family protein [bacterium]